MKIFIANDHTGIETKKSIINYYKDKYELIDLGTNDNTSCNYAMIAEKLANNVIQNNSIGIIICGSGEGVCMACNKVNGIRCGLAYNKNVAKMIKLHNNANVIAFGAREFDTNQIIEMLDIFLNTEFEGGRHQERIDFLTIIEKNQK